MREIIQMVIETEAEAKRIVEAAREEAERLLLDVRSQRQNLLDRARQEARLAAEKTLEGATQEAGQEKQVRLAWAAAEIETQIGLDEATKQCAVEGVLRWVCGFG